MQKNTLKTNTKSKMTFPNAPFSILYGAFTTGPLLYLFTAIIIGIPALLLLLIHVQAAFILLAVLKSPITMGVCGMLGGSGMLLLRHHELSEGKMPFPNAPFSFLSGAFITGPLLYLFTAIIIGIPALLLLLTHVQAAFILLAVLKSPITMGVCGMLGGLGMLCLRHHALSASKPLKEETTTLVVNAVADKDQTPASSSFAIPTNTITQDTSTQTDNLVVIATRATP